MEREKPKNPDTIIAFRTPTDFLNKYGFKFERSSYIDHWHLAVGRRYFIRMWPSLAEELRAELKDYEGGGESPIEMNGFYFKLYERQDLSDNIMEWWLPKEIAKVVLKTDDIEPTSWMMILTADRMEALVKELFSMIYNFNVTDIPA